MGKKDRRRGSAEGTCRLTGDVGPFIDSHIIPKALTRPAVRGAKFIQISDEGRSSQRPRSWFDSRLVTRAGEDILAQIDGAACRVLRQHKLTWSSWDNNTLDTADHTVVTADGHGIRSIEQIDNEALRLFIYSLLWRAGASTMPEFSEIDVPAENLEKLKNIILGRETADRTFYPATMVQISTLGVVHNHAPLTDLVTVPQLDGSPTRYHPTFRFYFDGLVLHIHRPPTDVTVDELGPSLIAGDGPLLVFTVPYEKSLQRENLEAMALGNSQAIPPRGWAGRI